MTASMDRCLLDMWRMSFCGDGPWWLKGTVVLCLLLSASACSVLEPIDDPEPSELQLTVDTIKGSLRDAQRTMMELREEVEARRQELADVQIARAQLEGRLREAERRLGESRQVIELQREELAQSRTERERMAKAEGAAQSQLKQLKKQLSKMRSQLGVSPTSTTPTLSGEQSGTPLVNVVASVEETVLKESAVAVPRSVVQVSEGRSIGEPSVILSSGGVPLRMVVKRGDTLSNIARRYHISVSDLKLINALSHDVIQVGQWLWLPEPVPNEH